AFTSRKPDISAGRSSVMDRACALLFVQSYSHRHGPQPGMIRIVAPDAFLTQPWKNGGGVTHEIARAEDAAGLIWRLSVAEVAADGPFSPFPGLARILTVIDGAGMVLDTPEGPIAARPLIPVAFPGDLPVHGQLVNGHLRDLNVIFDPRRIAAAVSVVAPGSTPCAGAAGRMYACLARTAGVSIDGRPLASGGAA